MTWQPVPSVNEPHYLDITSNATQKCINAYLEKTSAGYVVRNLFGYSLLTTVANNAAGRGAIYANQSAIELVTVHGNKVYKGSGSSFTALTGTLDTSSGFVVWAAGLSNLMLVDGTSGYIVDITGSTVTKITDGNFPSRPLSCACFNGQFIVCSLQSDRWYMSKVDDGSTWTPIISGRNITHSDYTGHILAVRDTVLFFGTQSIEIWSASSVDPFLQPITGATIQIGTRGFNQVAQYGDTVYLYGIPSGGRGGFYRITGAQVEKISTPYIDEAIGNWHSGNSNSINCAAYSHMGNEFFEYWSTSDSNSPRWLFNATSGTWSELSTTNHTAILPTTTFDTSSNGVITYAFDSANGNIYQFGTLQEPAWHFYQSANNLTLDFAINSGVGIASNQGLRFLFECFPTSAGSYSLSLLIQKSDDSGATFDSGITVSKSFTAASSIATQVIIKTPPLGSFKGGRVYRMTITDPNMGVLLRRAEGLVRVGRF